MKDYTKYSLDNNSIRKPDKLANPKWIRPEKYYLIHIAIGFLYLFTGIFIISISEETGTKALGCVILAAFIPAIFQAYRFKRKLKEDRGKNFRSNIIFPKLRLSFSLPGILFSMLFKIIFRLFELWHVVGLALLLYIGSILGSYRMICYFLEIPASSLSNKDLMDCIFIEILVIELTAQTLKAYYYKKLRIINGN